jgi:asparagine N-glycosylation enzyme membrane subunit Stt3
LVDVDKKQRNLEIVFLIVFSVLVFALFFFLLGANGLVLGNDPAVHLQRAQFFFDTGRIPLNEITLRPPFCHILLSTFMAFTGATSVEQVLVLVKAVTALFDWLLVFSVYLVAAKFFGKKTGVLAGALLLLCFPLYELNFWGGYTSILALSFMALTFLYLALPLKSLGSSFIAFLFAFSMVMSHELAAFLSVFILPPFIIVVLVKSEGHYRKALIAAILGGGIAFGLYYLRPILPYLGDLVRIIFFELKIYQYQIPAVSFSSFIMYFGFIIFFAFSGLAIAFFELKKRKSLSFYLLLAFAFFVPLFLSQSYLVGVYLPYQRFVYYILPFLAVLAGVSLSFIVDLVLASYLNNRNGWKRLFLKGVSVAIVVVLAAVMVVRFQTVSEKIGEGIVSYSITDVKAYDAGSWIKSNFPDPSARVIVTQKPGHWFSVYSGKNVIAETDPVVEWNINASSVLDLSYELEHPLTMVRAYEAKGNISDENYVSINMVWKRVTFSPEENTFLSFRDENDTSHSFVLSSLNRTLYFDDVDYPKKITVKYSAEDFVLAEYILLENDTYPMTVVWELCALKTDLNYAHLYVSYYFDPKLEFTKAYVPGSLNWENPWIRPSKVEGTDWAIVDFSRENLTDSYVDVYDETNQVAFGVKFLETPKSGNLGALGNGNIDAVRFQFQFYKIDANSSYSVQYQVLSFAGSSYSEMKNLTKMNSLFGLKVAPSFEVKSRNFASIIRDNYICFIVYDAERFDRSILRSRWLDLVYSNDKYVVCKIKSVHP